MPLNGGGIGAERRPDVGGIGEDGLGLEHADDAVGLPGKLENAAEDIAVAAQDASPESRADEQDLRGGSGLVLFGKKAASA